MRYKSTSLRVMANTGGIPSNFKIAIMQIVGLYYQFREPVSNIQGANLTEIPLLENLLWNHRVLDFSPTEGQLLEKEKQKKWLEH